MSAKEFFVQYIGIDDSGSYSHFAGVNLHNYI